DVSIPGISNSSVVNLGFLARALEESGSANILATPNLLTLDNEEARITIGQNVPFITGQFLTANTGANVSPFQTIERRDVGTTLRVRPQISEGGLVKMQIFQEVASVDTSQSNSAGLITNRRAIESNVLVDDGQMVVLGGLIQETVEGSVEKVPGLGDLPVVGQLFRFDKRSRKKTNLLVFLRPVVLRSAEASWNLTADRYDFVRRLQADIALPAHNVLPDFTSTPLPPMTPRPDPASSSVRGSSGGNPASIPPGAAVQDSGPAGAAGSAGSSLPAIVPGLNPRSSGLVLPPESGLLPQ
ncbi:MAG: type II secretion system protein GspD, partial [Betaproteobacteria bacterium]|nr:type II secretion system protein GspD [Betaproteobacteria bacterium]